MDLGLIGLCVALGASFPLIWLGGDMSDVRSEHAGTSVPSGWLRAHAPLLIVIPMAVCAVAISISVERTSAAARLVPLTGIGLPILASILAMGLIGLARPATLVVPRRQAIIALASILVASLFVWLDRATYLDAQILLLGAVTLIWLELPARSVGATHGPGPAGRQEEEPIQRPGRAGMLSVLYLLCALQAAALVVAIQQPALRTAAVVLVGLTGTVFLLRAAWPTPAAEGRPDAGCGSLGLSVLTLGPVLSIGLLGLAAGLWQAWTAAAQARRMGDSQWQVAVGEALRTMPYAPGLGRAAMDIALALACVLFLLAHSRPGDAPGTTTSGPRLLAGAMCAIAILTISLRWLHALAF